MGEILGLGITHYPNLATKLNMSWRFQKALEDQTVPERFRSMQSWHPTMREQWGNDRGAAHSERHRADLIAHFRKARRELDAFKPDFVLIWGDDQYENFREDCVPAFSILAYDAVELKPWKGYSRGPNAWDEPEETTFVVKGHRAAGKYLATALLKEGIDLAYAYKPSAPSARTCVREFRALPRLRSERLSISGRAVRDQRIWPLADCDTRRAALAVGGGR